MFDITTILTIVTLIAGYGFVLLIGSKIGAGQDSLASIFSYQGLPARPQGTQEPDLPPFVFRDAPAGA